MKPLFLTLVNVGPFRNEKIDFTALDDMFLVYGNTGAGKTTIFDAMTFALYGDLSGSRKKDALGFRSDFAGAEEDSFVEFTFELYHSVYRIRRTLPCVYITKNGSEKKRPSDVTLEKGSASLFDSASSFSPVQGSLSELNAKILSIINLSITEFTQIVLLPQGAFAQFLHAGSQEKRAMLSKLFPIDEYLKIMEKVKSLSDEYQKKSELIEAQLAGLYESADLKTLQSDFKKIEKNLESLTEERKKLSSKIELNAASRQKIKGLLDDSLKAQKLQEKSAVLEGERNSIEEKNSKIQRAVEAEKLAVYIKRAQETSVKLEKSAKQKKDAELKLDGAQKVYKDLLSKKSDFESLKRSLEKKALELEKLYDERKKLLEFSDVKKAFDSSLKEKNEAERELQEKKDLLSSLEVELFSMIPQRKDEKTYADALQSLFMLSEQSRIAFEKAQKIASDADAASKLTADCNEKSNEIATLKKKIIESADLLEKASACLEDYKTQKDAQEKNNYALALVPRLKEGLPCPVCGSLEHPHPAIALKETLDIDDKIKTQGSLIDTLRREQNDFERDLSSKDATLIQYRQNLKKLQDIYETLPEKDCAKAALEEAKADCEKYQSLYKKSLPLGDKIKEKSQEISVFSEKIVSLSQKVAAAEGAKKTLEAQLLQGGLALDAEKLIGKINAVQECIKNDRKSVDDYDEKFRHSESDCASLLSSLTELKKILLDCEVEHKTAFDSLKQRLSDSSFTDSENALSFMMDNVEVERLKNEIEGWKGEMQSVRAQLETLKDVKPSAEIQSEMDALESEYSELHNQDSFLDEKINVATEEKVGLKKQLDRIQELEDERKEMAQNGLHYSKLCHDLDGHNPKKIPFDAWVLGMYFSEVVSYANVRFQRISGGRYRFKINPEAKGGNSLRGLDLLVSDSFTGKDRDTSTLSGGETFMASISLALALTDVVQAQSGGIRLDSLFIDEGFGSLDNESLDMAITILQSIQESRMVGIISHVEGLMQSIPSRLEVIKGSCGSHVRIV